MAEHNELGLLGENRARDYLVAKGYKIRTTNYHAGRLEIDIIAEKDGWLVIVEVRTRSTDTFLAPEESIDLRKIRNLVNAAGSYIKRYNWLGETRFDIISVMPDGDNFKIEHIEDAFLPPLI
ncbi:MAG: YraN family protein [Paludibacter sp.]|nr:YraN family protein [Paludibacter sp.]MDD4198504.1 YraN family protein [Paludibacter sp.]MDD4427585.1 YraN family protein [Paludibacter sp.]